jgi:hypothetical protein
MANPNMRQPPDQQFPAIGNVLRSERKHHRTENFVVGTTLDNVYAWHQAGGVGATL